MTIGTWIESTKMKNMLPSRGADRRTCFPKEILVAAAMSATPTK